MHPHASLAYALLNVFMIVESGLFLSIISFIEWKIHWSLILVLLFCHVVQPSSQAGTILRSAVKLTIWHSPESLCYPGKTKPRENKTVQSLDARVNDRDARTSYA